jgi:hypothetical protein
MRRETKEAHLVPQTNIGVQLEQSLAERLTLGRSMTGWRYPETADSVNSGLGTTSRQPNQLEYTDRISNLSYKMPAVNA